MKVQMLCLMVFLLMIMSPAPWKDEKAESSFCFSILDYSYILEEKIKADDLFPQTEIPQIKSEADLSQSVFIGNSKIEGLRNSGLIPEADYICKVGWNIGHLFDEEKASGEGFLIDDLGNREYDKLFLMFGDNELGWNSVESFIDAYQKAIEKLQEVHPDAKIYILSVFPVSLKVHKRNQWGVNNTNVTKFNQAIKVLCEEKGYHYLDIYSVLADERGTLPDSSSLDGVHPNVEQLEKVVDYIKENAKE